MLSLNIFNAGLLLLRVESVIFVLLNLYAVPAQAVIWFLHWFYPLIIFFFFSSYIPAVHLLLYSIVTLIYSLLLQFVLMLHMFGFGKHRVNGASLSFVRQAAQNPPVLLGWGWGFFRQLQYIWNLVKAISHLKDAPTLQHTVFLKEHTVQFIKLIDYFYTS